MSLMKLHGALLAKGRLLGVQFLTLFKDDLYIRIGRHADRLAGMLKEGMMERGYRIFMDSPTNVIAQVGKNKVTGHAMSVLKKLLTYMILVSFSWDNAISQSKSPVVQFNNVNMETSNYPNRDYLFIMNQDDGSVALCFNIENDDILALGDEMNEVREEAYMNGYNWEVFLNYYLAVNAPEILEDMETDSEAGGYVAYYEDGTANEGKVKRLADIIVSLVENKEEIFKILREKGNEIEWD